jgi:hypothetical protein
MLRAKSATAAEIEIASLIFRLECPVPELRGASSLVAYFVHLAILTLRQER